MSQLRHSVPLNTLIQIYRSLIFPYTYYRIAAWGQAAQVYLRKVFILQKWALWLMFVAGNRSHAIPLFVSANLLPLNMLYFETVCSLMHPITTHSVPQNICDLFTWAYALREMDILLVFKWNQHPCCHALINILTFLGLKSTFLKFTRCVKWTVCSFWS